MMKEKSNKTNDLNGLRTITRKKFNSSQIELIKTENIQPEKRIPLVVRPAIEGVNLLTWATNNQETIKTLLLKHRALLFRNFNVNTTDIFNKFIKATSSGKLLEYSERSSPRHEVGNKIYTSTDYPADQTIFLHNEGTYWLTWPLKIYFGCLKAAQIGGETPIADCRNVFERINPKIKERFIEKKVLYVRNYNNCLGLSWEVAFQTTDKTVVEEYCRCNGIEFEWKDSNCLRTRSCRQAIAKHPQTGEIIWFNHATFFHVSTLEATIREALLAEFKEEDLPNNTYYGDGSPIELSVLDELRDAYEQEKVIFKWQEGDVLMLDNMSIAHGRTSFVGTRQVIVGMAEAYNNPDI